MCACVRACMCVHVYVCVDVCVCMCAYMYCVGSSRALVLASGCYFRSVHAGTNEVRASQLAQA